MELTNELSRPTYAIILRVKLKWFFKSVTVWDVFASIWVEEWDDQSFGNGGVSFAPKRLKTEKLATFDTYTEAFIFKNKLKNYEKIRRFKSRR